VSKFLAIATRSVLTRATKLGFHGCLECATEDAIANGGFRRRIGSDHEYEVEGGLVVRTRYEHERTAGGPRKFLIVGVDRINNNGRR
jgi:hypothetical protein